MARTIAADAMSYYPGTSDKFVDLPSPYYWWQMGAFTGSMLDYSHYTGDTTYDRVITTALLAQVGPNFNYMSPAHEGQEGNDDQAMWGFSVMAAAERNFPQPRDDIPSWLKLAENIWNSLVSRWDETTCDGGLRWQIFASNPNGLDYKNTVSNGGLFQLSARLARATGNQTYAEWANKVYTWTVNVGMIDENFSVHDGASSSANCTDTNPLTFSYTTGIYLYGAAVMFDHTSDPFWADQSVGLLRGANSFFSPYTNSTNVMYEHACEEVNRCNTDMRSFKAYTSRFMWASTLYVPSLVPEIETLLQTSAAAASQACTGGSAGTTCGHKWWVGGFDGTTGLGEEMCALETIQGLLVKESKAPLRGDEIKTVKQFTGEAAGQGTAVFPSATGGQKEPTSVATSAAASLKGRFARRGRRGWRA